MMKKRLEQSEGESGGQDESFSNYIPKDYFSGVIIEFVFYITNLALLFLYRDRYVNIPYDKENIVFDYYSNNHMVKIPIYTIIVLLGVFINRLENLVKF
jgi:hypothetical protein